jgi:hypothetical protein
MVYVGRKSSSRTVTMVRGSSLGRPTGQKTKCPPTTFAVRRHNDYDEITFTLSCWNLFTHHDQYGECDYNPNQATSSFTAADPDSAHQMNTNFYTASYTLTQTTTATIATWLYPLEQNSTATIWRRCASYQAHPHLRTSVSASFAKRTSTKCHTTWWLLRLVRTSSTASASSVGPRATARSATPVPPAAWSCISMYR